MITSSLPLLSLPSFHYKFKKTKGNRLLIYDIIRKKYVVLTPEEWTRQHFVHYLIRYCHYMATHIRIEKKMRQGLRADILVYNTQGKPTLLVECKSSLIDICTKNILPQMLRYNQILKASQLVITNGIKTHAYTWRGAG